MQSKILKTYCGNCKFFKEGCCDFNLPIDGYKRTDGFCRAKRFFSDPASKEDVFEYINSMCVFISFDEKVDSKNDILEAMKKVGESEIVRKIVAFGHNISKEFWPDVRNALLGTRKEFNIVSTMFPEIMFDSNISLAEDYCWAVNLTPGNVNKINEILKGVAQAPLNSVMVYFENEDVYAAPYFAFKEMGGNLEANWLDKVESFDNWKDVCLKIENQPV